MKNSQKNRKPGGLPHTERAQERAPRLLSHRNTPRVAFSVWPWHPAVPGLPFKSFLFQPSAGASQDYALLVGGEVDGLVVQFMGSNMGRSGHVSSPMQLRKKIDCSLVKHQNGTETPINVGANQATPNIVNFLSRAALLPVVIGALWAMLWECFPPTISPSR
jgi:hypothetical protein